MMTSCFPIIRSMGLRVTAEQIDRFVDEVILLSNECWECMWATDARKRIVQREGVSP